MQTFLKNLLNNKWLYVIVIAILVYLLFSLWSSLIQERKYIKNTTTVQTDTIYVDRPYKVVELKKVEVIKPVKVYIHKTDTVYRKQIERDTIITAVKLSPRKAEIHTITPIGEPLIQTYVVPNDANLTINNKGQLQVSRKRARRKKFWKKVKNVGIFVGGLIIGNQAIK